MINKDFTRYSFYKKTGIEWLGEVPEHWGVSPLGIYSNLIVPMRDKPEPLNGPIPWIRIEDFDGKFLHGSKSGQGVTIDTVKSMNLKIFPIGTVLCSCSCNMGRAAVVAEPLISNQTFIGIVPQTRLLSDFLYYLMQVVQQHLSALATGAIQQYLSRNDFSRLRIPIPPIEEQRAIADYLDRVTVRIDESIAKYQRLINVLEEKRTTITSNLITQGTDGSSNLVRTKSPWLLSVPSHWKIKRVKHLIDNPLAYGASESATYENPDWPRFIRITDIDAEGRLRADTFKSLPDDIAQDYELKDGDILFARSGATVGKPFLYRSSHGRACFAGYLIRCRLNQSIMIPEYFYLFTQSHAYKEWKSSIYIQATIQNISAEKYNNLPVPVPPLEEQKEIIQHIIQRTHPLLEAIQIAQRTIEHLTEYRMALISNIVTGKHKLSLSGGRYA